MESFVDDDVVEISREDGATREDFLELVVLPKRIC